MGKTVAHLLTRVAATLGLALAGGLIPAPAVADEIRVLVIASARHPAFEACERGFRDEIRRRGYTARPTIVLVSDRAAAAPTGYDLVLALGTPAAAQAERRRRRHPGVPVVYAGVGDPVGAGLAPASASDEPAPAADASGEPGPGAGHRACAGVASLPSAAVQLDLVAAILPDTPRVGIVFGPHGGALAAALAAEAGKRGLHPVLLPCETADDVARALARAEDDVDALLAVVDPRIWSRASIKAAVLFSLKHRRPLFGFSDAFTRAGAVASVATLDYEDMGAQAAELALAALSDAGVGDGPSQGEDPGVSVVWPRRVRTSVNLVVARRMGIEPPRSVVRAAEAVFR